MKPNLKLLLNKAQSRLTNNLRTVVLAVLAGVTCVAGVQPVHAQSDAFAAKPFVAPTVFQAAGTSAASIQSTVDQFRAALGVTNNGNNPGQTSGHREINWDGGSPTNATTSLSGTPLTAFLEHSWRQYHHTRKRICPSPSRGAWQIRLGTRATPRSSTHLARCGSSRRLEATLPRSSSRFRAAMATRRRLPLDLAWFLPTLTPQMAADQETEQETGQGTVTPAR